MKETLCCLENGEGFCSYSVCTLCGYCGKIRIRAEFFRGCASEVETCGNIEKSRIMNLFCEQYQNQIAQLANRMQGEAMPPLTEELFALFETTGNRLKYEDVYFKRRKFLAVFGMAAYLWGRPADVEKLEEILVAICEEECWALPAHVNRGENPNWRNTVDLFAAETAQALAEIVTLVNKAGLGLSEGVCTKVKTEIESRVLCPFEQSHQGWECSNHNWNAVCGGSIGSAAIYLLAEQEKTRLDGLLKRICYSLSFYLDGFPEDGVCMEGIGYFTYGMTYFVGFAEQLLRYSQGSIDLFANAKVRKIAEFQQKMYFNNGQTVSFSDGDKQAKFRMGLTAFLAKQYDTVQIPNRNFACDFETDPCYRFMGLLRDVLWTGAYEEPVETAGNERAAVIARHEVLASAQWSICESNNGIGFAIKGGNNGEPHNHNDVGSFLYSAGGEQFLCDLGAGEYTGEYFGSGRYDILCNSSEGHNIPIMNGEFQKAGAQYRTSFFEADGNGATRLECSMAYGEEVVSRFIREARFSLEDGKLSIQDCFDVPESAKKKEAWCLTENLVTQGEITVCGNTVTIRGKQTSCRVQIENEFQNLRCVEKVHFNHEGDAEKVCLIQWDVIRNPMTPIGKGGIEYDGISKYTVWKI